MNVRKGVRSETCVKGGSHCSATRALLVGLATLEGALLVTLAVWVLALRVGVFPLVFAACVVIGMCFLFVLVWRGGKLLIAFFRGRCQFGLRALLLTVLAVSVLLGGLRLLANREADRARKQKLAAARLAELNPRSCGYQLRPSLSRLPECAIRWLGGIVDEDRDFDYLGSVTYVDLSNTVATDEDLACLRDLPDVKYVDLAGTRVSDAGLQHLRGLSRLQSLSLKNTRVTAEGIEAFREGLDHHVWIER